VSHLILTQRAPAALISEALVDASMRLAARAARDEESQRVLRAFTFYRTEQLLQGPARITGSDQRDSSGLLNDEQALCAESCADSYAAEFPVFVGDTFSGVITSYLDPREFGVVIQRAQDSARLVTDEVAEMAGQELVASVPRIVVYGGLAGFAAPVPHDTVHLHVEELAEMLADTAGDMDTVAQFLREISTHPSADGLLFVDVLDVWWHWKDHQIIGSLFPQDGGVAVLPYEGKPDWGRAGAWESIEEVLAAAGMPSATRWPSPRLDEPGQATLPLPPQAGAGAVLVRSDPPLLVMVSFEEAVTLGISADGIYGLADGLRITAGRHQDIADFFRLPDDVPLTCVIQLTAERQPPQPESEVTGIGVITNAERHCVSIQLGPEFLETLTDNAAGAHEMLGWVLQHAVTVLRTSDAALFDESAASFLEAWKATPPVMMINRFENTAPAVVPGDPLPRGQSARARAFRTIALELQQNELPDATLSERDVLLHMVGATEAVLRRRLTGCTPAVIDDVAAALNAAHAAHWRYRHELKFALSAPWALDWQAAALEGEDPTVRLRPLELLLEFLVFTPPEGGRCPDRYEIAEIEQLARVLLETRTMLNALDVGLGYDAPGEVAKPTGQDDEPSQPHIPGDMRLDHAAYAESSLRDRIRVRASAPQNTTPRPHWTSHSTNSEPASHRPPEERTAHAFESLTSFDLPRHLVSTDALMRTVLGTGLDGIRAVLGTAVDWSPIAAVTVTDSESLAQAAEDWSGLPRPEIDAAVALLTLKTQHLHQEAHRYWEVERRAFRLRTRPFPVIGGRLWIMPWAAEATQELFTSYFLDSRLPYIDPALRPAAATAMRSHRQKRNEQLETEAGAAVQSLGLAYRLRWTGKEARTDGLASLPGEVDLLIADVETDRLWVCEIKDPETAFSPAALHRHIERFVRTGGHIDKLLLKTEAISQNPVPAARACGIHDERTWQTIPLMLTRQVEPAGFLDNPRVAFAVLEDLPTVLAMTSTATSGHLEIGG
jgi:hypothetical protein